MSVPNGQPYIFDWVVLREVEKYVSNTVNHPRKYARVIMVDDAWESKIDEHNLSILNKLEQREAIDLTHIRKEEFAGESYRGVQYDLSDAMVAIGGGKGTYIAGQRMTATSQASSAYGYKDRGFVRGRTRCSTITPRVDDRSDQILPQDP